jgi:serine/threonine protein kinase
MIYQSFLIIYTDIKGPNLLITKEGMIKLADFGIAVTSKVEDEHGKFHGSVVEGSPFWMVREPLHAATIMN